MVFWVLVGLVGACGGSEWGAEMSQETPQGMATMFRGPAVEEGVAQRVFDAMVAGQYNFASGLPEQVDRVDGRLVLRLGNDNEESIADVEANGEASGVVSYMHGLAAHVSQAIGGEAVDIVLCRRSLDAPYYTVKWQAE